jgi:hypothetical protein
MVQILHFGGDPVCDGLRKHFMTFKAPAFQKPDALSAVSAYAARAMG